MTTNKGPVFHSTVSGAGREAYQFDAVPYHALPPAYDEQTLVHTPTGSAPIFMKLCAVDMNYYHLKGRIGTNYFFNRGQYRDPHNRDVQFAEHEIEFGDCFTAEIILCSLYEGIHSQTKMKEFFYIIDKMNILKNAGPPA